jgi:rhodanese-related sulfurtransferase
MLGLDDRLGGETIRAMNTTPELPLEISVTEVEAMRKGKVPFLLLDCREPHEHELVHISGSTLIPMGQIPERLGELEPRKSDLIVVHCHHGGRSMRVTQWLRNQGFLKVQNMAGGIDAWSLEVDGSLPRY